jgi:hypothetical protein
MPISLANVKWVVLFYERMRNGVLFVESDGLNLEVGYRRL